MFNKLSLTAILLTSSIYAKDSFSSERFLGIEAGYGTIKSTSVIEESREQQGVEFGFRLGAQNKKWRTTISGHFFDKKGQQYLKTLLQFDRFVWSSHYETDDIIFKPYIGAHVGWVYYTNELNQATNGFVYGGQAGITWNVLKEVDFDFGYRYSLSDVSRVSGIGGFVFGVNYLY